MSKRWRRSSTRSGSCPSRDWSAATVSARCWPPGSSARSRDLMKSLSASVSCGRRRRYRPRKSAARAWSPASDALTPSTRQPWNRRPSIARPPKYPAGKPTAHSTTRTTSARFQNRIPYTPNEPGVTNSLLARRPCQDRVDKRAVAPGQRRNRGLALRLRHVLIEIDLDLRRARCLAARADDGPVHCVHVAQHQAGPEQAVGDDGRRLHLPPVEPLGAEFVFVAAQGKVAGGPVQRPDAANVPAAGPIAPHREVAGHVVGVGA